MKILFLSRWLPYPATNGSKLRILNLLQALAGRHQVHLLTFVEPAERIPDLSGLAYLCQEIQLVERKPYNPSSMQATLGFFRLTPRSVVDTFSTEMKERLQGKLAAEKFDLVIASQVDMAAYSPYFAGVPALLEELEVGILYERPGIDSKPLLRLRAGMTWWKHRRYLSGRLRDFNLCTVVSEPEKRLLSMAVPEFSRVEILPNCVDLEDYKRVSIPARPNTLIFTGSFSFSPNYDAMYWFIKEIFPLVRDRVPEARLFITGDRAGRKLPEMEHVEHLGFVEDVREQVAAACVSLAPIRFGGGTRLKILEAMALMTPVVATTKGAEGLEVRKGEELLVADTPAEFAEAVVSLLCDPGKRQILSECAFDKVAKKYDWKAVMPRFLDLVERAAV